MENIHPISVDQHFNNIYFTYYKDGQKHYINFDNFKNYFYFSDYDVPILNKKHVTKQFGSLKQSQKHDFTYEADIKIGKRFMLDTFGKKQILEKIPLRIGFLDIEALIEGRITIEGTFPVSAISIYDSKTNKTYTFAFCENKSWFDKEKKIAVYKTEIEMLTAFTKFMQQAKFDLITGWNVTDSFLGNGFDIPYLCNRLNKFKLMSNLSIFGIVERHFNEKNKFNIFGTSVVDYMSMYKKFSNNILTSYSLQNVVEVELKESKLVKGKDLNELYRDDFNKYIEYNRKDALLVKQLDDKTGFIDLLDEMRRMSLCNFEETINISNVIDNILIKFLNKKGCVVRSKKGYGDKKHFAGAYVKEPTPGIYSWVIILDFTSLYPFIIMNFNISPETKKYRLKNNQFLEYDVKEDEIITVADVVFKKDVGGIFPKLMKWIYSKRKEYKKLMNESDGEQKKRYNSMQQAFKILLNAFYGFTGFQGGRFFDIDLASSITLSGQALIKFVIRELEKQKFNVITSDTDSVFCTHDSIVDRETAFRIAKRISAEMNAKIKMYCKEKFNITSSNFDLEYEKTAKNGIFFKKKHYALNLIDKEGKKTNEIAYTGISIKKSDTCNYTRQNLKKLYEFILNQDNIEDKLDEISVIICDYRKNIESVKIEDIAIPISMTKKISCYTKNLPIFVRGAKVWEKYFADITNVSFKDIQKGKLYFIKNTLGEKELVSKDFVICVPIGQELPASIIIDYERTKERVVERRLKNILEILDNVSANKKLEKYIDYEKENLIDILYYELSDDFKDLDYILKLDKISYKKRFDKFVSGTLQGKLFKIYCTQKNIEDKLCDHFSDRIISLNKNTNKKTKIITEEDKQEAMHFKYF